MEYRTKMIKMDEGIGVVIPDEVVEKLNIQEGEKFSVEVVDDQIIVLKPMRYKMNDEVMIIR